MLSKVCTYYVIIFEDVQVGFLYNYLPIIEYNNQHICQYVLNLYTLKYILLPIISPGASARKHVLCIDYARDMLITLEHTLNIY